MSHDAIREQLHTALREKFPQDEPYSYVSEVFDGYFIYCQGADHYRLGYSKTEDGVELSASAPVQVVREVKYVSVSNSEEADMAKLNDAEKKTLVDGLIANCKCGGGNALYTEEDRPALNSMSDETLKKLSEAAKPKTMEPVTNSAPPKTEDPPKAPVTNSEPAKQMTPEEWWKFAPVEVRNTVNFAHQIETDKRGEYVAAIVANERYKAAYPEDELKKMATNDLKRLADLAKSEPVANTHPVARAASYFGAGGGPAAAPVNNSNFKAEPYVAPSIDYAELAKTLK